jgi:predicted GNAT family acetyltransferase
VANCFFLARVAQVGIVRAQVWGAWSAGSTAGRLRSVVMLSGNLVPAGSDPEGMAALARWLAERRRTASSVVGLARDVSPLWEELEPAWGPARDCRWHQPLMVAQGPRSVAPDPRVRRATVADIDALYPPTVSMFTEEVGVSPLVGSSEAAYRGRLAALVRSGRVFVLMQRGEVVFKAEVAAATAQACQVQGVWVDPDRRGLGLGSAAMAAVVDLASAAVAPVVSLYVNEYNVAALRAYRKSGFVTVDEMASILF